MRSLTPVLGFLRGFALVALVIAVAACSRTPAGLNTGVGNLAPGAGTPGSQQEFLVPSATVCFSRPIRRA